MTVEPCIDRAVNGAWHRDYVTRRSADNSGNQPGPAAQSIGPHVKIETVRSLFFTPDTNCSLFCVLRPQKRSSQEFNPP